MKKYVYHTTIIRDGQTFRHGDPMDVTEAEANKWGRRLRDNPPPAAGPVAPSEEPQEDD